MRKYKNNKFASNTSQFVTVRLSILVFLISDSKINTKLIKLIESEENDLYARHYERAFDPLNSKI